MRGRVEIIERTVAYAGFLNLVRYRVKISRPSERFDETLSLERIEGLRAAAVLPFDPANELVVLVKQFRIGALDARGGAWLLEPPGGVIDAGESSEDAARREAFEEAGCSIGDMVPILSYQTSPGISDERVDLFCGATNAGTAVRIGGRHSDGEWTEVVALHLDDAIRDLGRGMLTPATLIIAVQWLAANRGRLRALWGRSQARPE